MIGEGEDAGARGGGVSRVLCLPCSHNTGDEAGGISNRSGRNLLRLAVANFCWGRLSILARGSTVGVGNDFTVGGADGSGVAAWGRGGQNLWVSGSWGRRGGTQILGPHVGVPFLGVGKARQTTYRRATITSRQLI
jgi:hypothetical protein